MPCPNSPVRTSPSQKSYKLLSLPNPTSPCLGSPKEAIPHNTGPNNTLAHPKEPNQTSPEHTTSLTSLCPHRTTTGQTLHYRAGTNNTISKPTSPSCTPRYLAV